MWSRADLKQRAKNTFRLNYWKCVLVSLILALVAGGAGGSSGAISSSVTSKISGNQISSSDYDDYDYEDIAANVLEPVADDDSYFSDAAAIIIFAVVFIAVFVVIMILACLVDVFICNPLEIGGNRFYIRNLNEKAQVGNVGYAFDTNYLNMVKIMFFKDLYTILWSLLFIIPGIVKSYEYMMIPYLLAENPQMSKDEAFAASRQMMTGNKWKAFVLDLSFIGWHILAGLTCGILEIFYVAPYVDSTHAALYTELAYGRNEFTNNASDSIVMENTDNM